MLKDNVLGVRYGWWLVTISTSTRFALSWKRAGTVTASVWGCWQSVPSLAVR